MPEPVWIGPTAQVTMEVPCEPHVALNSLELAPTSLVQLSDSLLAVVDVQQRRFVLIHPDGRTKAGYPLTPEGPTGILDPRNVALVGDSLLVFADGPRGALRRLTLDWEDAGSESLGFPPDAVAPLPDGVLVSRLALGDGPSSLLYKVGSRGLTGLEIPPFPHDDWRVRSLVNSLELSTGAQGQVVVAHRFLVPRAYTTRSADSGVPWQMVRVPLPDEARRWWGEMPTSAPESGVGWLTPVLAGALHSVSGDYLYLTRSGREVGGHSEKVILRVDSQFTYLGGVRLPVNAGFMALDVQRDLAIVVDGEDRWFTCPLP
ncbi:MAG: hypothetical protein WEA09_02445 [Gemmatimonadota bacterium]